MKLSVIIPTLNEEHHIKGLLQQLVLDPSVEIIVVDGGSDDRTCTIVGELYPSVKLIHSNRGRAEQMNRGALNASGEVLLFLHADTLLPDNYYKLVEEVMSTSSNLSGSFYLKFDEEHPLLSLYSRFSRINNSFFTYGDQAIFIRKNTFSKIGGYKIMPIMEDLEIQKRLRKEGAFVKLDSAVVTSARKYLKNGFLWNQLKNAVLVIMYTVGFSPTFLAKFY